MKRDLHLGFPGSFQYTPDHLPSGGCSLVFSPGPSHRPQKSPFCAGEKPEHQNCLFSKRFVRHLTVPPLLECWRWHGFHQSHDKRSLNALSSELMRVSRPLVTTLKVALAVGLVVWMVRGGRLDLSQVAGAFERWPELAGVAVIYSMVVGITAWRWNLLLRAQGIQMCLREAFSLTMIGLLFNIVIPGSVGGDVMKGYYVSRRAGPRKTEAFGTILVDRMVGLLSLLTVASLAAAANVRLVRRSGRLAPLGTLAITAVAAGVLFLALAVVCSRRTALALKRLADRVPLALLAARCVGVLVPFQKTPSTLPLAFAVSVPCHVLACLGFYLSARAVGGGDVPFRYFLSITPLGLLTTALPVAPCGLGVGQAAFYWLFELLLPGRGTLGANAFTVYQFVLVMVCLSGFYFYLSYRGAVAAPAWPQATGTRIGSSQEVDNV